MNNGFDWNISYLFGSYVTVFLSPVVWCSYLCELHCPGAGAFLMHTCFWLWACYGWSKELGQNGGVTSCLTQSHILKYHQDKPQHLSKHPKTTPDTRDTNRHHQTSSYTFIRPTDTPQIPLKNSQSPLNILAQPSKARLFLTWIFWDI